MLNGLGGYPESTTYHRLAQPLSDNLYLIGTIVYFIYFHLRLDTGEIFYVGKGQGKRAYSIRRNNHWRRIVAKHGRSIHIHSQWGNEAEAFAEERRLIASFLAAGVKLVNQTDGGEGSSGHSVSVESRAKIGAASKGRAPSVETRAKMSAANKGNTHLLGHTHSAETKAKISAAGKGNTYGLGHIHTAEARAKISAAGKGRILSPETRARMVAAWKVRREHLNLKEQS